jgi:hypothetical protein
VKTHFRIFFDFQYRPPRPYIAIARLATPPFFFYEKVGGEIVSYHAIICLMKKVAKTSSRTEAVSGKISLGQHCEKASLRLEM